MWLGGGGAGGLSRHCWKQQPAAVSAPGKANLAVVTPDAGQLAATPCTQRRRPREGEVRQRNTCYNQATVQTREGTEMRLGICQALYNVHTCKGTKCEGQGGGGGRRRERLMPSGRLELQEHLPRQLRE